jgi:hypothetical protein
MPRFALLIVLATTVLAAVCARADPVRAAERWRRPLPGGAVAGAFHFERSAPYARGRRRGVDFSGRPRAPVLAACSGRVTFAGRVPGWRGRGVSLRCGALVATELGLSVVSVRRGSAVLAGARIGTLGARTLRLGARLASDRHGYLDPLTLITGDHAPVAPPPVAAHRRRRPRAPLTAPHVPSAARAPAPARAAPLLLPVLIGAALIVLGAGGGTALRARGTRRRRRRRDALVARAR